MGIVQANVANPGVTFLFAKIGVARLPWRHSVSDLNDVSDVKQWVVTRAKTKGRHGKYKHASCGKGAFISRSLCSAECFGCILGYNVKYISG